MDRVIVKASQVLALIAGGALTATVLAFAWIVTARYVFKSPLWWSYDIRFVLVVIAAFSLAYAQVKGSHVKVGTLLAFVGPKVQRVFDMISSAIVVVYGLFLFWATVLKENTLRVDQVRSSNSGAGNFLLWPVAMLMAGGMLFFALQSIVSMRKTFKGVEKERAREASSADAPAD